MFREGGIVWYLIYPLAYPMILLLSRVLSIETISLLFMLIASLYSGMVSILLIVAERKIWPVPLLFPIRYEILIRTKIFIPVVVYTLEYSLVLLFFLLFSRIRFLDFLMTAPMGFILYYGSLFGARLFLKDADRDITQKNRLLRGHEIFQLEIATMGFSGVFFGMVNLYRTFLGNGRFWIFTRWPVWLVHFLFLSTILFLFWLLMHFIRRESKKITLLMQNR